LRKLEIILSIPILICVLNTIRITKNTITKNKKTKIIFIEDLDVVRPSVVVELLDVVVELFTRVLPTANRLFITGTFLNAVAVEFTAEFTPEFKASEIEFTPIFSAFMAEFATVDVESTNISDIAFVAFRAEFANVVVLFRKLLGTTPKEFIIQLY